MVRIEPERVVFPQSDNTEHILSHETIQFYFELKKQGKLIKPLDPDTGVFVFQGEDGSPSCYLPMGITVTGKTFPDDLMNL